MAFHNGDNVRESFSSSGTTISLDGAVTNSRALSSVLANGDTFYGVARKNAEIAVGLFTFNTGSPNTVTQTTVFYSTNSNAAVSFSSGSGGEVFIDAPASIFDELNLREISVVSATTCDIGAVEGGKIVISGTTTITSLGTTAHKRRFVRFSGALTLTHNATSLILPGGLNITTAAGDCAVFLSDSSGNWRCYSYVRADGHALFTGNGTIASATTTDLGSVLADTVNITGTTTITGFGSSAPIGAKKFIKFAGALTLTHNATSLIIPGAANITTAAGDCAIAVHEGSGNWRVENYVKASGAPIAGGAQLAALIAPVGGALISKLITFTRSMTASSGSVAYTGVGFQPRAILFIGQIQSLIYSQISFVDVANTLSGMVQYTYGAGSTTILFSGTAGAAVLMPQDNGPTAYQSAVISSFDSDGFTLSWTKTGSPGANTATFYALCLR